MSVYGAEKTRVPILQKSYVKKSVIDTFNPVSYVPYLGKTSLCPSTKNFRGRGVTRIPTSKTFSTPTDVLTVKRGYQITLNIYELEEVRISTNSFSVLHPFDSQSRNVYSRYGMSGVTLRLKPLRKGLTYYTTDPTVETDWYGAKKGRQATPIKSQRTNPVSKS